MVHFNVQLKELHKQAARKRYLEKVLTDLRSQQEELVDKVAELEEIKIDEQEDVERLEGRSLAALFYILVGKMDEMLDKERQEAYAARVKFDAAVKSLEFVEYEIQKNEDELETLQDCEEKYEQVLREKAEAIVASADENAAEILRLEERYSQLLSEKKELQEAIDAGEIAFRIAEDVEASLGKADSWATWDKLGGGILADLAKHDELDKAQYQIESLQVQLRKFKTELADTTVEADIQVNMDEVTKFADFFFDGLFIDWSVANAIRESLNQIQQTIEQIEELLIHLHGLLTKTECELDEVVKKIEKLVIQA